MHKIRVGIVGAGISGLSCAWSLGKNCDVTLFEKNSYIGGHSNTIDIVPKNENKIISVDTGFIVFNDKNYPNLMNLLNQLKVKIYNSDMSFSVSLKELGIEFGGESLSKIFAQKKNLLNVSFLYMLKDIVKFFLFAKYDSMKLLNISIDNYLEDRNYSYSFRNYFLYPMASSIWSTSYAEIKKYPFHKFIEFFDNHGLLNFFSRPQWKTILGGSREYIKKIIQKKNIKKYLNEQVLSIKKQKGTVLITTSKRVKPFDYVVFSNHSDEVYKILSASNMPQSTIFKKIKFQKNLAYLHSDTSLMPSLRKVWSSWNYLREVENEKGITLSYWMNNLQSLKTKVPIIVTLNPQKKPKEELTYRKIQYSHPVFNLDTVDAQTKILELNFVKNNRIYFCGAYLGNGFHEDGLKTGLNVAEGISKIKKPWQE